MAALYDPRSVMEEPWVPTKCQLSQKTKVFVRGSFATGTNNVGYAIFRPGAVFSNQISGQTTANNSAGSTNTIASAFTNIANGGTTNSPYSTAALAASLTAGLSWRLTAQTLYVKYTGTELNKGGDMVLIEEPSHRDLDAYSYQTALSTDGAKRVKVSNDWQSVSWVATSSPETDFTPDYAVSAPTQANKSIGVFVNTAVAAQPFDYELYMWFEVAGPAARAPSLSFNDPIGFAAVSGASDMFQQLDSEMRPEGFVRAVEDQLNNQSLPRTEAPRANALGLLTFLPALASMAMPYLKAAGKGAFNGLQSQWASSAAPIRAPRPPPRPPKPPVRKESLPQRPPVPPKRKESLPQRKR